MSVRGIQQKWLLNKICVYVFTALRGHRRVATATLYVACARDVSAIFRFHMTSRTQQEKMMAVFWL